MGILGIDIVFFLAIGLAAGWLAGAVAGGKDPDAGLGYAGSMAVGVLGAMLGGFVFHLAGWRGAGGALLASAVGAVSLLAVALVTSRYAATRAGRDRTPVPR